MRIKATVKYKGTKFFGWAKQVDTLTIQEEIEKVLSKYFNEPISIYASGRTDAGVHALGQVFHFDTSKKNIDLSRCRYSLNMMLDKDIHIISLQIVNDNFHSRYDAKKKTYLYKIHLGENDPFINEDRLIIPSNFDVSLFKSSLMKFVGKHNFQDFTSKEEDESSFVREIYDIKVIEDKNDIDVYLTGNGFMRYMVRYIIGTCIEIALKKESIDSIDIHLDSSLRNIISYKGSAHALYLKEVIY